MSSRRFFDELTIRVSLEFYLTLALVSSALPLPATETGDGRKSHASPDGAAQAILAKWNPHGRYEFCRVRMRDGVELAADVYLPPGDGPWPVVLMRSPYGRIQAMKYATGNEWPGTPVAWVSMDTRGDGDSDGNVELFVSDNEIEDGFDAAEWVSRQPWCNGRIGAMGGSGNGLCAAALYFARHPNVLAVAPANTCPDVLHGWAFENGVRKWLAAWCSHRLRGGRSVPTWPRPTLPPAGYDPEGWKRRVAAAARDNPVVYIGGDGWYNIFHDANLQFFEAAAAAGGKVWLTVSPGGHSPLDAPGAEGWWKDLRLSSNPVDTPRLLELLIGKATVPESPRLTFSLLGDHTKGRKAVGNRWHVVSSWPLPATRETLYLSATGRLAGNREPAGKCVWSYDPRDPAPFAGGGFSYGLSQTGPADQRPLLRRRDVLRFATDPLHEPLIVIGRIGMELKLAADVPDTTLIAKVVDVYPDGTEALIREGACMARYREGFAAPKPLVEGEPVKIAWELPALACAFEPGHRLAIYLTNSAAMPVTTGVNDRWVEVYEVHPNTWDRVETIEQSVVGHFTLHCGGESRLMLPLANPAVQTVDASR